MYIEQLHKVTGSSVFSNVDRNSDADPHFKHWSASFASLLHINLEDGDFIIRILLFL